MDQAEMLPHHVSAHGTFKALRRRRPAPNRGRVQDRLRIRHRDRMRLFGDNLPKSLRRNASGVGDAEALAVDGGGIITTRRGRSSGAIAAGPGAQP